MPLSSIADDRTCLTFSAPCLNTPPTPEQRRHRQQIGRRARALRRRMRGYAALSFSRRAEDPAFVDGGITELGQTTAFVLSRHRRSERWGGSAEVICLGGYRATLAPGAGSVALGGPRNCICAYDLAYRPFAGARGKILDAHKSPTARIGLDLDAAVEAAVHGGTASEGGIPELPAYWLGFAQDCPPVFENTPAARAAAVQAVAPDYVGQALPCLQSPGGTITDLDRAGDGVHVLFDDVRVAVLPPSAVLRPWVRVGMSHESGVPLGDFLPRRPYGSWEDVASCLGEREAAWLLREAVEAWDGEHAGFFCRRHVFAPGQVSRAAKVFEDMRHLLGREGAPSEARIQVWRAEAREALRWEADGLRVDLSSLRPEWEQRFGVAAPAAEASERAFTLVSA